VLQLLPSPAGLLWGISPPPASALRAPCPLYTCLFFFFLFSLGGGQSVHGAMLICPRVVCGSTAYRLAHLVVCVFLSYLGTAVWWRHRSSPGFSI
jgi:hypothetical protein